MTNRELKKLLKTSYRFSASDSEKDFIKRHKKSSMQLWDILKTEFGFMGWKSAFSGLVLLTVLIVISKSGTPDVKWYVSGMLPLFALLMTTMIGSSERYRMEELEASCRFSLNFVHMVRMLIIGVLSLVIIIISTLIVEKSTGGDVINILCCVSLPYLINVFACLFITRKTHDHNDICICAGSTGVSCLIPLLSKYLDLVNVSGSNCLPVILVAVVALTVRESIIYIKEGEIMTWNLC